MKTKIEVENRADFAELFVHAQFKELEQSEAAQFFQKRKDNDNSLFDWDYIKGEIKDILAGEWNLENLRTPEMAAAWMYLYIFSELQQNQDRNVTLNLGSAGRAEIWLSLGDHVFPFDFEPLLRDFFETEEEEEFQESLDAFRNMLDLIEHEKATKDRAVK